MKTKEKMYVTAHSTYPMFIISKHKSDFEDQMEIEIDLDILAEWVEVRNRWFELQKHIGKLAGYYK
jgi:hypothetical protein